MFVYPNQNYTHPYQIKKILKYEKVKKICIHMDNSSSYTVKRSKKTMSEQESEYPYPGKEEWASIWLNMALYCT